MDGRDLQQITDPNEAVAHAFEVLNNKVAQTYDIEDAMKKLFLSEAVAEDALGMAKWLYGLLNDRMAARLIIAEIRRG